MKRNLLRTLLLLHFIGLALSVGTRVANLIIDRQTSVAGLQALSFGRDLTGVLARSLVLPGFLLMAATGIAMTLVRYGLRPPVWVWIKVGLNVFVLFVATPLVAPALAAARAWAHWSFAHNQLAPQFLESASRASLYGAIVFTLFLLNIPVAIWKPYSAIRLPRLAGQKLARTGARVSGPGE
jgi:hypothetical protein